MCQLPPGPGPCSSYVLQWHFDPQSRTCRQFWYGGCGGNENRFQTEEDCHRKCADNGKIMVFQCLLLFGHLTGEPRSVGWSSPTFFIYLFWKKPFANRWHRFFTVGRPFCQQTILFSLPLDFSGKERYSLCVGCMTPKY